MTTYLQAIYQQGWDAAPGARCPHGYLSNEARVWLDGHRDKQLQLPDGRVRVPLWARMMESLRGKTEWWR